MIVKTWQFRPLACFQTVGALMMLAFSLLGNTPPDEDPNNTGKKFSYNLRFPGQVYDKETGLAYNYFRNYDSQTGRYVESDPDRADDRFLAR